jgi:hypothetical protein
MGRLYRALGGRFSAMYLLQWSIRQQKLLPTQLELPDRSSYRFSEVVGRSPEFPRPVVNRVQVDDSGRRARPPGLLRYMPKVVHTCMKRSGYCKPASNEP